MLFGVVSCFTSLSSQLWCPPIFWCYYAIIMCENEQYFGRFSFSFSRKYYRESKNSKFSKSQKVELNVLLQREGPGELGPPLHWRNWSAHRVMEAGIAPLPFKNSIRSFLNHFYCTDSYLQTKSKESISTGARYRTYTVHTKSCGSGRIRFTICIWWFWFYGNRRKGGTYLPITVKKI